MDEGYFLRIVSRDDQPSGGPVLIKQQVLEPA
jgi:hypothetical protein